MTKRGKLHLEDSERIRRQRQEWRASPHFREDVIDDVVDWLHATNMTDSAACGSNTSLFEGQPVNVQDENGRTSLHTAAALEQNSLTETTGLVERNANIHVSDNSNRTPIYYAVQNKNWDTCEYLILRGAEVERDISQQTVVTDIFEEVARLNFLQRTGCYLNYKFEINWAIFQVHDEEFGVSKHNTILHLAVKCGRVDWVRQLIQMGADVEVCNSKKHSPLHLAVIHWRNKDLISVLLEHGAIIDAQDYEGKSPLHRAIERNLEDVVQFLLQKEADVNIQDDRGMSPLHCSLVLNNDSISRLLLLNSNINVNIRNHKNETPLHCTTSTEMIELLVNGGADLRATNEKGHTALFRNIIENNIEVVRCLLEQGADSKQSDEKGILPIRYAVTHSSREMVQLFTDLAADGVNDDDREIIHLIQLAVRRNQFDTVQLLCQRLNEKKITPTRHESGKILLQALSSSSDDVVGLLITERVVDVSELVPITYQRKKPQNGDETEISDGIWAVCPVDAARDLSRYEVIPLMIEHGAMQTEDERLETKLHSCAKSRRFRALQNIIRWTSLVSDNVTVLDENRNTPLHVSCVKSRKSVIKYLATIGRDCLTIRNTDEKLPVHLAMEYHPSMVEVLEVDDI